MRQQMAATKDQTIEDELLEVSKLKAKDYPNRQDELAAILRAMEKVPNKEFDTLSNEAANWYNAAADAINDNQDIPEFDKFEGETSDDHDHEADEADSDSEDDDIEGEDDESDPDDEAESDPDEDQDEVNEGSVEEDEDEPPPPKKTKPKKRVSQEAQDVEAEAKPKKGKKAAAKQADDEDSSEPDAQDEDETPKKPKPKGRKIEKTPYDRLSGAKDKFGLYDGTQTSKAAHLYEQGATVKHVSDVLGGKHRNVLKKLEEFGHRVEKLEGGVYKVTHRDLVPKKAKKK